MKRQDEVGTQTQKLASDLENAVKQAEKNEQEITPPGSEQQSVHDAPGSEPESTQARKPEKALGKNRGIETMFRAAYRVQMDLTALADNKANMMISINGIIISIIIAAVAPKLDANPWLMVPSSLFLIGTLVSILFAIQAARPRIKSRPISIDNLLHSEGDILFFGDFSQMSKNGFLEGMIELIGDRSLVYKSMIRNIYGLGSVLQKKFTLLQLAYTSFMVALVLGVTSFIAVFVWILL